jgi:hypothetical protein
MPREQDIQERAYELWELNGKPEGKNDEFWQIAARELAEKEKEKGAIPSKDQSSN